MKKSNLALLLAFGAITLAGCAGGSGDSSSSAADSSVSTGETSGTSESVVGSSSETPSNVLTNEDLPYAQTTYTDENGETQNLNIDHLFRNAGNPHVSNVTPASGNKSKLLVAPFTFQKDASDPYDTIVASDELYEKIRIAFEGTPEEIEEVGGYISVKEFYERSSFNKGAFEIVMLPCWVEYNGTPTQFRNASGSGAGLTAANYVRDWYMAEYAKADHGLLGADWEYSWSDLDSDNDGYLDLIWTVYTYPQNYDSGDWWAYVSYSYAQPNYTAPNIKTLAWASTGFMSSYNGYDSHTFIHETGHTFGLMDYYDYTSTWKPMGGVDYMDQNLGDHCAYSKFTLGWVNPWVLREEDIDGDDGVTSAEITLRATTTSGDCLVLASPNYNNTAFDEYLMVELMGPYGLAEKDYINGYSNTTGFREPGIRVTHVDARVTGNGSSNAWTTWRTDADDLGQNGTDVRICNTYGGRSGVGRDSDFWNHSEGSTIDYAYFTEISLMQASTGSTWLNSPSYNASMSDLYTEGSRLVLGDSMWTRTFFPSRSALWNKAQRIVSGTGTATNRTVEIDETCTANYSMRVLSIEEDPEYGAVAKIRVTLVD